MRITRTSVLILIGDSEDACDTCNGSPPICPFRSAPERKDWRDAGFREGGYEKKKLEEEEVTCWDSGEGSICCFVGFGCRVSSRGLKRVEDDRGGGWSNMSK